MGAPRVIAIDGPAGSGKTTTARAVARALGFAHLDSGALYRAVTLAALEGGVAEASADAILAAAAAQRVRLVPVGEDFRPEAGGVDVTAAIRSERVTAKVSAVAALPAVRRWVTAALRDAAGRHPGGVVVDGRDIGTVVFPEAPLKVFLTARPEERARRRLAQDGRALDEASVAAASRALSRRDAADSEREVAPLKPAPDAWVLDTTGLTFAEQVEAVVQAARRVFASLDAAPQGG
jgi:cytidylate kinase